MSRIHRSLKRSVALFLTVFLLAACFTITASASQPGAVSGDSVRLRSEPNTDSSVINVLNTGDALEILDSSTEGWVEVSYTDSEGISYAGYLTADLVSVGTATDTAAAADQGDSSINKTANITGGGVRMRSDASTESEVLTMIADGELVSVLDESAEGWVKISYTGAEGSFVGYVASEFLSINVMASGVTPISPAILRSEPSTTADLIALVDAATPLDILASTDGWYQVSTGEATGFVEQRLIASEEDISCIGYGTVTGDSLCLRSEAGTDASILASLSAGVTFQITSNDVPGWYGAIFNGESGYVSADYVAFSEGVSTGYVQVSATSLTLRAGAGTTFTQLATIPEGTVLSVCGSNGSWYQVNYNGTTGFVSGAFVSATTESGYQNYPDFAQINATSLTLRSEPSSDAGSVASIANGVVVAVSGKTGDWYKVSYDGATGYIDASYTVTSAGPATEISHTSSVSAGSSGSGSGSGSGSSYDGGSSVSGGSGSSVADFACQFAGNPYVWGGTSLTGGVDCSGFVMQVYAHFGYSLPHSSSAQRGYGQSVSLENIQPGDIVCYSGHVGIYVGGGQIISALGAKYGITYSSVTYKSIITIRRIFA